MNDRPDQQTLLEVQDFFKLPSPALVEKDWFVVRALQAIAGIETDGLKLVFGGGTALGRAYGLLQRMSEDIDLRVVGEKAESRAALKRMRGAISTRLEEYGFPVEGHIQVKQSDKYVRYDLPYAPIMQGEGVLRPEIKIEIAAFPIRRDAVTLPVRSFCAEAAGQSPEVPAIACVALVEIAAEKFIALTRRIGAVFAGGKPDPTLVRHIYDLARLDGQYDSDDVVVLALETMKEDTARGYEAYQADALGETIRTTERLVADPAIQAEYARLMSEMVYGERVDFGGAADVLTNFAVRLKR